MADSMQTKNVSIVVSKHQGLTDALKDLARRQKMEMSDGVITLREWDKTISKLEEINNRRKKAGKIPIYFGGSDKKDYKHNYVVHENQKIEFSESEIKSLYEAMGVSFKKETSDQENKVEFKQDKTVSNAKGNTKVESAVQDSVPSDSSKVAAKVAPQAEKVEPQAAKEELQAEKVEPQAEKVEPQAVKEDPQAEKVEAQVEKADPKPNQDQGKTAKINDKWMSEIKNENGKYTLQVSLSVGNEEGSTFDLTADTKEELIEKAAKFEELRDLHYLSHEKKQVGLDENGDPKYDDFDCDDHLVGLNINKKLLEFVKSGDEDLQKAAAWVFGNGLILYHVSDDSISKELFNAILDTKNPEIIYSAVVSDYDSIPGDKDSMLALSGIVDNPEFKSNCGDKVKAYSDAILKEFFNRTETSGDKDIQGRKWANYIALSPEVRHKVIPNLNAKQTMYIIKREDLGLTTKDILNLAQTNFGDEFTDDDLRTIISKLPNNLTDREAGWLSAILGPRTGVRDEKVITFPERPFHVMKTGEKFRDVLANYVLNHNVCTSLNEKKNWSNDRKLEAAQEYAKDFEQDIAKQMGIEDPNNLNVGQVLDFGKVKEWKQPNAINWAMFY